MAHYQVIVGNIGTVYEGHSPIEANKAWGEYKEQSGTGVGRGHHCVIQVR